jgi:hypothetical protein
LVFFGALQERKWLAAIDQPDDDFVAAALDKPEEQERLEMGCFQ